MLKPCTCVQVPRRSFEEKFFPAKAELPHACLKRSIRACSGAQGFAEATSRA